MHYRSSNGRERQSGRHSVNSLNAPLTSLTPPTIQENSNQGQKTFFDESVAMNALMKRLSLSTSKPPTFQNQQFIRPVNDKDGCRDSRSGTYHSLVSLQD